MGFIINCDKIPIYNYNNVLGGGGGGGGREREGGGVREGGRDREREREKKKREGEEGGREREGVTIVSGFNFCKTRSTNQVGYSYDTVALEIIVNSPCPRATPLDLISSATCCSHYVRIVSLMHSSMITCIVIKHLP